MAGTRWRAVARQAVLALLLTTGGVGGWRGARGAVAVGRARAATAAEARALASQAPAWSLAADVRRARLATVAPLLLDADSEAGAGSGLDALLRGWCALHDARVVSVEPLPGTAGTRVAAARVRLSVSGTPEAVLGVVEKIEYGPRLLSIEYLRLQAGAEGTVSAELTVAGWYAAGGTP